MYLRVIRVSYGYDRRGLATRKQRRKKLSTERCGIKFGALGKALGICQRPTTSSASVILMAGGRFKDKEAGAPQFKALNQRLSVGNLELLFESLNDHGQSGVTVLPIRFSKLDSSNSPIRVVT